MVQVSAMKFTSVVCSSSHTQSSERSDSPINFNVGVSSAGTVVESPKFAYVFSRFYHLPDAHGYSSRSEKV